LAALHAGLFVLATSNAIGDPRWVCGGALFLGLLWFYIQWASLAYVNRLKPRFHTVCNRVGFHYPGVKRWLRFPTNVALVVPGLLTLSWITLLFVLTPKPPSAANHSQQTGPAVTGSSMLP
jgi:hypothetical protein